MYGQPIIRDLIYSTAIPCSMSIFIFFSSTWQTINPISIYTQLPVRIELAGQVYGTGFGGPNSSLVQWRAIEHDFNYFDFVIGVPDPSFFYNCSGLAQKNSNSNSNQGSPTCPTTTCPTCSNPNVTGIATGSFFGGASFMVIAFILYQMRRKAVQNPQFNIEDPLTAKVSAQLAELTSANERTLESNATTLESSKP